ncbi:MAG TPA: lipid carrier--UDP-N-acetylgalactosaminyltransferase, partial [Algoriphagus sp.]|nr:lipid carrier--UDP-N-acetylgalactosaminyltransferase [Algoriphagus sp.]
MYRKVGKRLLDLLVAGTLFLLLSPLFLFLYLTLFLYFRGNPIFKQTRPGFQTIPFSILKFKTMTDKKDSSGNLLPDSERITKFGRVIRKFSLDEMPQLLNVIRGDMSLVGPRPLLMEYLPLYNKEQIKRHLVKPGVSGWAQVNGRNTISWEEKFEFDTWYVENVSFLLD